MSEPETEPTTPEPPTEPEAPDVEPDADPDEDAAEAAATAAEPEQEQPVTDKEIDAVYTKLETRAKNYVKSVSEILYGHEVPVALCELCSDAYPGMRWVVPADEQHAAMIAVSGSADVNSPLLDDPDALLCDRCNGFGWTKLPSHVPGNEQRLCRTCNGVGWLDRNPRSGTAQAPVPEPVNGEAEAMPGVPENDPSVVDLRARGFTVIPPMSIAGAEQQGS